MAVEPDSEPLELLDVEQSTTESTTEPVVSGSGRRNLTVLIAVSAVAALLWGVGRAPGDGRSGESAGDRLDPAVSVTDEGTAPATTITTVTGEEGGVDEAREVEDLPLTTTTPSTLPPGPVLGEETGLSLFYGGSDLLQRLDLDTGEIEVYGIRARPVLTTANQLVVMSSTGSLGWVSLDDPGQQPDGWLDARVAPVLDPGPDDVDQVWFCIDGEWRRYDLESNRILEVRDDFGALVDGSSRPVPDQPAGTLGALALGPDLISTVHGVWEWKDGDYRFITDGRLVTFDRDLALVEQCSVRLDECDFVWLDRTTWRPVPTLQIPERRAWVRLVGDGNLLHTVSADGREHELLVVDGTRAGAEGGPAFSLLPSGADGHDTWVVSPDGRYAAAVSDEAIHLQDLTDPGRGTSVRLQQEAEGAVLLVDQNGRSVFGSETTEE